ncbi:UDP-N-acetylmuramate--alanine ligase [Clostridiaceae bacterium JG1575]|nr:UDP-N-acetylmuramate--alanine ligase [Clostridiaceae bacterium JG1575]
MSFNLKEFQGKKVHLIGIGGSMMSGIAGILLENGIRVSGSDQGESKALAAVRRLGATVKGAHHKDNIYDQDLVIYTTAIRPDNPELLEATTRGIPTMTRSEFLGHLMKNFQWGVGIAGTHGKTTTTSMLTAAALSSGLDPTVLVGAHMPQIDSNYRVGQSEVFLVESCEYKRSFLDFPPRLAIILNVEEDHVDVYHSLDEVLEAFGRYVEQVPEDGCVLLNADHPGAMALVDRAQAKVQTFGVEQGDYAASRPEIDEWGRPSFSVTEHGVPLFHIKLPVPGVVNVTNALAATAAARILGAEAADIKKGLESYPGVDRRMQKLGEIRGIRFMDDYAHHPSEVKASMETISHIPCGRLIVVFQPHTFTRLRRFLKDFVPLFDAADLTLLLPVFAAREQDDGTISSNTLGDLIRERDQTHCINCENYEKAAQVLLDQAQEGDVVLLMGAGEGYRIYDLLQANETMNP